MNVRQKLAQFTDQQIRKHAERMLVPQPDGSLVAFGKYLIKKQQHNFSVHTWDRKQGDFSSQRSALGWCSAERHRCFNLSREIMRLDQSLNHLSADIQHTTSTIKHSQDFDFCDILEVKLDHKRQRLTYVKNELEKCLNRAKYIELKDFQNETARILSV